MNRKALLIGINKYDIFPQLDNCENDAKDISDLLSDNGFDCVLLLNPDLRTIIQKLSEYKKSLEKNTLSFIYFSGHGLQVEGDNFLVPKDASIDRTEEIPYFCVHASDLLVDIGYESLITHI